MAKPHTIIFNKIAGSNGLSLYRDPTKGVLTGVCAGIAALFAQPPWLTRLAFLFLLITTGIIPMLIIYLLLSFALEKRQVSWERDHSLYKAGIKQLSQLEDQMEQSQQRVANLEYYMLSDDFNSLIFDDQKSHKT